MNILTKIGVVVLLALVLIFGAMEITLTTVAPNYKAQFTQEQQRANTFSAEAINNNIATLKVAKELAEYRTSADGKIAAANGENSTLKGDLTKKDAEILGLKAERDKAQATVAAMPALLSTEQASRKAADEALKQLRDDYNKANTELAEATKQLRTREGEVQRYELQIRSYETTIADRDEQIKKLGDMLSGQGAHAAAAAPVAPVVAGDLPRATGSVKAVQGDVASVNLGSAKGVKKDMILTIYRGDKLVGTMRVTEVEPSEAGGIITDKVAEVRQGDSVTTSLK